MATPPSTLSAALAHHQAGRLREAETIYQQILATDPNHSPALHLLGLVAHQRGDQPAAEELIGRAIALAGDQALYHSNLGEVLRAAGKLQQAEQALRRALAIDPAAARAHNNLGIVLAAVDKPLEAIEAYRRAIGLQPTFAEPHNNLGTVLQRQGNLDGAIECYRQAVQLHPHYAAAFNNLGTALKGQGRLDEAAEAYRCAIELAPDSGDAQLNLGTVHQAAERLDEAIVCYRRALTINSRSTLAHVNLATALQARGELSDAIAHYRQALEIGPDDADVYNKLGTALKTQAARAAVADAHGLGPPAGTAESETARGQEALAALDGIDPEWAVAASAFRRAVECDPEHADALVNLGNLLAVAGDYDQALSLYDRAVAADPNLSSAYLHRADVYKALRRYREATEDYHQAIRIQPRYSEAYNNLAILCMHLGDAERAVECCRQGLEQDPEAGALYGNMATALGHQGRATEALAAARRAVELRPTSSAEFSNLLYGLNRVPDYEPATLFEEHLEWARRHAEPLTARAAPHCVDPSPERRLRVGYVSPYFREHAVNFFVEPLITAHDRGAVEIFCYSDVGRTDDATRRLQALTDGWRDVQHLSDRRLADLVRSDAVDILVDLSGHIGGNRLLAFARKPAPVQVTYIGYQNTTGMSAMDYRFTDERADPPGETDRYYTEQLVRLPRSYFCYQPAADAPDVTPLPARQSGRVTFGSFNSYEKVTEPAMDAWLEILTQVPESRLLLLTYRDRYVQQQVAALARRRGVDPERIEFFPKRPRDQYYRLLQQADITLDPFPFNGHTTTCDAIWLGVPVVMLLGRMYASRYGSSVLAHVGLDDLIAGSVEQYIERAVALAGQLDRLAELRTQLRPRMADSALLDFQGFARHVEKAYRQMWTTWCTRQSERRG